MNEIKRVGNIGGGNTQSRTVYLIDGLCPTLAAGMTHGNTIPYIIEIVRIEEDERDTSDRADG